MILKDCIEYLQIFKI